MTETEWNTCADPQAMLEFLGGKAGDRKLRLFACASCHRIFHDSARQRGKHPAMQYGSYYYLSSYVRQRCLPPGENVANSLANTFPRPPASVTP
jgi:hypothetical protein